jgi:HD-GYP domain-containing protein (c-di-GMP phosphodiesterase class II)
VYGTGLPVRILMFFFHLWARLLAIFFFFETFRAMRPGRGAATPESVLEYQRQQAETRFDGEFVECWISAMTKA